MWVTKLLISPVKKGFFAQKRPNLAQNWHFWSIWAWPCRLIWCPVYGSVGGCGARAVSRKTPIYFICNIPNNLTILPPDIGGTSNPPARWSSCRWALRERFSGTYTIFIHFEPFFWPLTTKQQSFKCAYF